MEVLARAQGQLPDLRLRDDYELRNLYLQKLSESRMLVIIDEVHELSHIEELIPLKARSGLILISQQHLVRIQPGLIIHLAGLAASEARQLVDTLIRERGDTLPPEVVDEIIKLANGNPFIINVLIRRMFYSDSPESMLRELHEEFRSTRVVSRLRTTITIAYETLNEESRHALRLLSAFGGLGFTIQLASEVLDTEVSATEEELSRLMDASLLIHDRPDVYHLPHSVQEFARERLLADENDYTVRRASDIAIRSLSRRSLRTRTRLARDMWTAEDALGYNQYARAISTFIQHRETKAPLSIAVLGRWGAGKTSLMRMVQERLDPRADRARWTATRLTLDSVSQLRPRKLRKFSRWRVRFGAVFRSPKLHMTRPPVRTTVRNLDVLRGESRITDWADHAAAAQEPHGGFSARPYPASAEENLLSSWRATVWFNPWKYEQSEQLWAGLANEIISQITERLNERDRQAFWLALNLKRFDKASVRQLVNRFLFTRLIPWLVLAILSIIFATSAALVQQSFAVIKLPPGKVSLTAVIAIIAVLGVATRAARLVMGNVAKSLPFLAVPSMPISSVGSSVMIGSRKLLETGFSDPNYPGRLGFLDLVQGDVAHVLSLVATEDRPLVVFIDDLDRCSSSTISRVIESINLFLAGDYSNCIFVLGLDASIVASHIASTYEKAARRLSNQTAEHTELGWSFLEKFVQLPLILPRPNAETLKTTYMKALLGDGQSHDNPSPPANDHLDSIRIKIESSPDGTSVQTESLTRAQPDGSDARLVSKLERAISTRAPTPTTISRAAYEAEKEVFGVSGDALRPETLEAATRLFARLYSDEMAAPSIYKGLTLLNSRNPREIKRYLNLFRFYSFLCEQRRLQEDSISWDEVAKVAALVIRWPQVLGRLLLDAGDSAVLDRLERWIAHNGSAAGSNDMEWRHLLFECAVIRTESNEADKRLAAQLHTFLSTAPEIATAVAMLL